MLSFCGQAELERGVECDKESRQDLDRSGEGLHPPSGSLMKCEDAMFSLMPSEMEHNFRKLLTF